ncbi:MAG TPA: TolC family protein [bacterium]|nr:TolC family protein [bacterium]
MARAQPPPHLGEAEVIQWVIQRNLGIQAVSYDAPIAGTDVTKIEGLFDTNVKAEAYFQLDRSDKTSIVFGTDNRTVLYDVRAEKRFPVGVQGALVLTNRRDTTNSEFATDPAFFETILRAEVQGNLLRNRFGKSDKAQIALAKANERVVAEQALSFAEQRVAEALTQYWNWVAAGNYYQVARRFAKSAQDFVRNTTDKKTLGLAEETDTLGSQAQYVERQAEADRARNIQVDAEKRLRYMLDAAGEDPWTAKDPLRSPHRTLVREDLLAQALASRPEYLALKREAEARDIQIILAKDQTWPALDLYTSLETNAVDPGYGQVLGETFSFQNPNWVIGARFNIAIENRIAKGELERGKLEKARVLILMKEMENLIALQIDEQIRQVRLQQKEVANYTEAARLQNAKVQAEMEKFNLGRSDSDTIVRFNDDAIAAERRRLEAELRYRLAWVDLRKATGALLPPQLRNGGQP